jgi:hypothetical protein
MPNFEYILNLLEAKGWFLYEGMPDRGFPEIISAGRARSVRTGIYYHLVPATSHDASVAEVCDAAAYAMRHNCIPRYNDGLNKGPVDGIYISDGEFAFVSKPSSFTFSLDSPMVIEDAIKFNLSNYNTYFFGSIEEIAAYFTQRSIAPQRPPVLPSQLRWTYTQNNDDPNQTMIWPENPGDVLFRGQGKRYIPCVSTACRGIGIEARSLHELSEANQVSVIVNFIRTQWFIELLQQTSAVNWLNLGNHPTPAMRNHLKSGQVKS